MGVSLPPAIVGARVSENGNVVLRGTWVMAARRVLDGYLSTGDLGHLDSAGRLFIDGRADDMIISGGENVFPGEVEESLATHPQVAEVAVIGVSDDQFGQRLHGRSWFRVRGRRSRRRN